MSAGESDQLHDPGRDRGGPQPEPNPDASAELLLASACAEGDPGAIALFERRYMTGLGRHLCRMHLSPSQLDEVRQRLRISLLTGPRPGIATFSGRAPLDSWVRVAAIRAALRFLATERAPVDEDSALTNVLTAQAQTDLVVDESVRRPLRAALERALRELAERDRAILRLHFLDGLNIDAIGALFHVHRATVARWLVRIRVRVFHAVRSQLAVDLRPSSSELRSLIRLARRDVEVSLDRVLADGR
jgi:RNA polymerase sigma-70 factor, ECF subfamily